MKPAIYIVLFVATFVALPGCKLHRGIAGSGVRKTEKRDLKPFTAVDLDGAYQVNVTCQTPAAFEIDADDNLLPLIKTEVHDGILFIKSVQEFQASKLPAVRIALPDLDTLTTHGAGQIRIANVNNSQLGLDSDGAATIDAAGTSKSVTIGATGAGMIDATNLHAEKVRVSVSGAANIDVYATEQLDVDIAGVSRVSYSGNPKTVNKHVTGVGSVGPKD